LLSEVLLTNLAIVHCGWLSQITCSACQLTVVVSTINTLPKASRNCRWINQTDLLFTKFASLWRHQRNTVTHLFISL